VVVNDDESEAEARMEAIRGAVPRPLREGEVDPRYVVLVAAGVTGELGADIARLGDVDHLVREAGRAHAEGPPVAGSA